MRRNPKVLSLFQAVLTTTLLMVVVFLLALLLTTSCQHKPVDLDEDGALVRFSFTTPHTDTYQQSIRTLRFLLYDVNGILVKDMSLAEEQWRHYLVSEIPDGCYTIVILSNATTLTSQYNLRSLDNYLLKANTLSDDHAYYGNTDHLFWTMQQFTVRQGQMTDVLCPLADIHCHLHVHVQWKGVPRQSGVWTLRMYGVPVAYYGGRSGGVLQSLSYPLYAAETGEHRTAARVFNYELDGDFVTFRWTEEAIPSLQLWCDDEPVSALMNLREAFEEWKWHPGESLSQDYYLELTILEDGSVDMQQGGWATVDDWEDGGTIGG